jgi:hypothetical protein
MGKMTGKMMGKMLGKMKRRCRRKNHGLESVPIDMGL